jgi:hypothetical protein
VQIPCTQGEKPKKFTLQGQINKKLQEKKTKLARITGDQPIYPNKYLLLSKAREQNLNYIRC